MNHKLLNIYSEYFIINNSTLFLIIQIHSVKSYFKLKSKSSKKFLKNLNYIFKFLGII